MGKGARRGTILALAVAAGAAAIYFGAPTGSESRGAARPDEAVRSAEPKKAAVAQSLMVARPRFSAEVQGDVFAGARTVRAPVKAAPVAAAPAPVTPPFPYKYAGRFDPGSGPRIYLQKGNELIAIKPGEMLDGVWRVDTLTGDRIEVSFVPGGQQLSMTLASLTAEAAPQGKVPAAPGASPGLAVQPAAAPAFSQSAPRSQLAARGESVTFGGMGVPAPAARASVAPGATAAAIQSQNASAGPGNPAPVPTGKLGVDAPTSGSMPTGAAPRGSSMPIGPASSGTLPTAPPPAGKLGLE